MIKYFMDLPLGMELILGVYALAFGAIVFVVGRWIIRVTGEEKQELNKAEEKLRANKLKAAELENQLKNR